MVTTERLTLPLAATPGGPSVLNTSALWKRDEQLRRWQDSETNFESSEPKRSCKVSFQQPCVFLAACASGDQSEIYSLLYNGVDINTANIDGMTALHQACIDGNFEIVKFLHRNGANINYQDNEGWSPLHAAASCGNLEITKYLVAAGADLTSCTSDRELAVDLADGQEVRDFLQREMDSRGIDESCCRDAEHRLMLANTKQMVAKGDMASLKLASPKTGATLLHVAAANGYDDVLKLLLETGMDPNCKDFDGWTPLHAAAHWDNVDSAKTLMEFGGDCDAVNNAGHQVWDVCEEAMFATLINFRAELKNRAAAKSAAVQKATQPNNRRPSEMQKSETSTANSYAEHVSSSSDSVDASEEPFEDVDRNRTARDVATPARELSASSDRTGLLRKNERIGRLQESLRTLSERFRSNEVNIAPQPPLEDAGSNSENASNEPVEKQQQQMDGSGQQGQNSKSADLPLAGDFVASRRTRFETAVKEATNSPIRRLGGVVKSESEDSQSGSVSKSWGSCVGSLRFDSSRFDKRPPNHHHHGAISRFDVPPPPPAPRTRDETPQPKRPNSEESSKPLDGEKVVRKKPASVIAGVTAVTVSSPLPLTVTANVSVSSNSSSSPPESAARVLSMRSNRLCASGKDEQAEAERKKRSAKARRERRSTQGVSRDDLAQALANNKHGGEEPKKPDRWTTEASTTDTAEAEVTTVSKPPISQPGLGIQAEATPVVTNKSDEFTTTATTTPNESADDLHALHRRKQKPLQRRLTGQILWYEFEKNNGDSIRASQSQELDVKPITRLKPVEDTVDSNNVEGQRGGKSVAVQTSDAGFLEKFSLCQLKTRCQELTRENDKLSANLKFLIREIYDKDELINKLKSAAARVDQADRRRVDTLRADNIRLKEENAALIRVISKMSKQS